MGARASGGEGSLLYFCAVPLRACASWRAKGFKSVRSPRPCGAATCLSPPDRSLMPYRRHITIGRQSDGGLCSFCHPRSGGHRRNRGRRPTPWPEARTVDRLRRVLADQTIDRLADQVGVTDVPRVLLDDVHEQPPDPPRWTVRTSWDDRPDQKSMRMTTRRGGTRETSVKPAAANVPSVPTCSSSETAFLVVMG